MQYSEQLRIFNILIHFPIYKFCGPQETYRKTIKIWEHQKRFDVSLFYNFTIQSKLNTDIDDEY